MAHETQVIAQIWVLLLGGLGLAGLLDVWAGHDTPVILGLSAFGSFISYIYSAPPLKVGRPVPICLRRIEHITSS